MNLSKEQQKGQEVMQALITKAWESATLKEQLIANPQATIEKVTGQKFNVPDNATLVVEDQTDSNTIYLNIPRKLNFENIELTDEQLEIVSGGEVLASVGVGLAIVGLFAAGIAIGQAMQ